MLDAEGRKKRAKKASARAVKKRKDRVRVRDKCILLAYKYLAGKKMKKSDFVLAEEFLIRKCGTCIKPDDVTINRFLADGVGVTRERIRQILLKLDNSKKQNLDRLP